MFDHWTVCLSETPDTKIVMGKKVVESIAYMHVINVTKCIEILLAILHITAFVGVNNIMRTVLKRKSSSRDHIICKTDVWKVSHSHLLRT